MVVRQKPEGIQNGPVTVTLTAFISESADKRQGTKPATLLCLVGTGTVSVSYLQN
jgi:hypothetical protein